MVEQKKSEKMPGLKQTDNPPNPAEEKKETIIAIALILLLIIGIAWWMFGLLNPDVEESVVRVTVPFTGSPMLGEESAPVTVVIFSDFECPFCGDFTRNSGDTINELVASGTIRVVFKQYPLSIHPNALDAAQASMCAYRQEKFWEYHDMLFQNQRALAREDLLSHAQTLGLDAERFESCLVEGKELSTVEIDRTLGSRLGVTGTPTFFFNGRRVVGLLSSEQFRAEVQKEI